LYHTILNRAGGRRRSYQNDSDSEWESFVLPGAWKNELCEGYNASTIARALVSKGLLLGSSGGKTSTTLKIKGQPKMRVYHLSRAILADTEESQPGNTDSFFLKN
jgi:hypothetical protein